MVDGKVDKHAVEQVINDIMEEQGTFAVPIVRDRLKRQGLSFGDEKELVDFAERQKTRQFIGRLLDPFGKRKYIPTKATQMSLDFGTAIYYESRQIERDSEEEKESLGALKRHMIGLIKRTPLLPQWAINEIVAVIEKVFTRMRNAA